MKKALGQRGPKKTDQNDPSFDGHATADKLAAEHGTSAATETPTRGLFTAGWLLEFDTIEERDRWVAGGHDRHVPDDVGRFRRRVEVDQQGNLVAVSSRDADDRTPLVGWRE